MNDNLMNDNLKGGTKAADRILYGRVLILDAKSTVAEGIAVAGDKIIAVGDKASVAATRRAHTEVRDFGGAAIIPGFNDTHAHMDSAGMQAIWPSLAGARSIQDVLCRVRDIAAKTPRGDWIVTMPVGDPPFYFDPLSRIAEKRMPTRRELDSVAPDHPVYIASPSGYWGGIPCHSALNSLGLKLNGIDRNTRPSASGIEIVRDGDGEPSGVLIEQNFANLAEMDLLAAIPRFGYRDRVGALRRGMRMYHEKGTTSIYEGHGNSPEVLAGYRDLRELGELTMRVNSVVAPTWKTVEEAASAMRDWLPMARGRGFGDAMLRVSGIFIGYGGDPAVSRLVHKNVTDTGWFNMVLQANTAADYESLLLLAAQNNLRVHTIISDRLHEILPIVERIAHRHPIAKLRWVFEHISRASAEGIERIRKLGVGVTLIPPHFLWKVGSRFADLPEADLDYLSPAKQLYEAGVPVSAGTDAFPHNPLFCMWTMVAREERTTGKLMGGAGRTTHETALRLLTTGGAWLSFEENVKGPLAPGYFADIAVLSGDPLATPGKALPDIECIATMVGGHWVHGA
ncbi:MAG: amidohydrolase [Betaproteobacteria bacterium]|nr:amidohydrolase [Betaproteobacteria bacterium]